MVQIIEGASLRSQAELELLVWLRLSKHGKTPEPRAICINDYTSYGKFCH